MSPIPPEPKKSIQINIITTNEEITRVLRDRVCLKIGRQVKSPQEKLATGNLPQDDSPTSPASPGGMNDIETIGAGFSTPIGNRQKLPSPDSSTEKLEDLAIWFKSKVVSRAHAEIWYKDGHVFYSN